ncbi:MAG: hypothetical protein AAGA99_00590 [Actinomycetota bacterium]
MIFNRSAPDGYLSSTPVRRLTDRHDIGYASFGYGGEHLFIAYSEDCFAPALYVIRADTFDDACETADYLLGSVIDEASAADYDLPTDQAQDLPDHVQFRPDGVFIDTEAVHVVGPLTR